MKVLSGLFTIFALSGLQASHAVDEADFASALLSGSASVRSAYLDKVVTDGVAPSSLAELGLHESYFQTDLVEHVDIEPDSDAIMVGLAPQFGQNEWVALIPEISNFQVLGWTCQSTVSNEIVGNSGCKGEVAYSNVTKILDANLFASTVAQINAIKNNASESLATSGSFPRSMNELGVNGVWLNAANVSHVMVMPYFNSVQFAMGDIYGVNQWVAMRPRVRNGNIVSWTCKTTLPDTIAQVSGCTASLDVEDLIW